MSKAEQNRSSFLDRLAVLQSRYLDSLNRSGHADTPARRSLRAHMASASNEDLEALARKQVDEEGGKFESVLRKLRDTREICRREVHRQGRSDEAEDLIEID